MFGLYFGVRGPPRYLLWSALIGFAAIVAFVLSYRHLATDSILEQETQSNKALARILARAVWPRLEHLVADPGAVRGHVSAPAEVSQLRQDVLDHMRDTRIVKVNIYDPRGMLFVSTDASQNVKENSADPGVAKAQRGEVTSLLGRPDRMDTFAAAHRHVVTTYVPISGPSSPRVVAEFQVFSDVTDLMDGIDRHTVFILIGLMGTVLIIYAMLSVHARRVNRVVCREHEQRVAAEAEIRYQAYHDRLTGLPNRRSFYKKLDTLLAGPPNRPESLAVMFLDLDNFKLINDGFGHSAGDNVLRTMAQRLSDCLRRVDRLYHMNGDKFIIVLTGNDLRQATRLIAERMLKRIAEPVPVNGQPVTVTFSIGVSLYPDDGQDGEQLVRAADNAMYCAKDSGRNQYKFHRPGGTACAIERLTMESELRQAAGSNQFTLYYQPRVSVAGGEIVAVEALIRWPRPGTGIVCPQDIIPFLERNGLIEGVGRWVLKSACEQLRTWWDHGVDSCRVSVNVSPRQFLRRGFVSMVEETIADIGVPPDHVELELTESMLLDTNDDTAQKLKLLKELGVIVTMDDFGTGYSSLNYLRCMPIDYLKIDKTFVARITDEPKDAAVVSSILSLAHELGVHVVAEGVETQKQLEFLRAHACEEYQGFLYSKPIPAAKIECLFRTAGFWNNNREEAG